MPWLSSPKTLQIFADLLDEAAVDGRLATVLVEGRSYDLTRHIRIGYDFVVRVQDDEPFAGLRALERALHVLGIDRRAVFVGFGPAPAVAGEGGADERGRCSYAVLVHELGNERDVPVEGGGRADRLLEADDDAVVGAEDGLLRAHVEQSHVSSPTGGVSASTVGDASPAGAGFRTPTGQPASPLLYVGGPDHTEATNEPGSACAANLGPTVCTRGRGHRGHHAAGNGEHVVAMWLAHDPARVPAVPGPERLAAGLTEILTLHAEIDLVTGDITCDQCGACAPCPTSRAAATALQEVAR